MLCLLALLCLLAMLWGIVISLKDPVSKQPLPDFSGLRMRDACEASRGELARSASPI